MLAIVGAAVDNWAAAVAWFTCALWAASAVRLGWRLNIDL
jgi:hypothetical protein